MAHVAIKPNSMLFMTFSLRLRRITFDDLDDSGISSENPGWLRMFLFESHRARHDRATA
jgi:hypothetical protein